MAQKYACVNCTLHQLWPSAIFFLNFFLTLSKENTAITGLPSCCECDSIVDKHCSSSWDLAEASNSSDNDDSTDADNGTGYLGRLVNCFTMALQQVWRQVQHQVWQLLLLTLLCIKMFEENCIELTCCFRKLKR